MDIHEVSVLLTDYEVDHPPVTESWRVSRRAALDSSMGIFCTSKRQVATLVPGSLGHNFVPGVPNEEYTIKTVTQEPMEKVTMAEWVRTLIPVGH